MKESEMLELLLKKREQKELKRQKEESTRQRLNDYINNYGVRVKFIAEKANISKVMLSYFKNGKKDLSLKTLERLIQFLDKYER